MRAFPPFNSGDPIRRAVLAAVLLAVCGSPVAAQYGSRNTPAWYGWPGGFIAAGRGGTNADLFQPRYALAAGYQTMSGGEGLQVGARAVLGYASFRGDHDAYRDALHLASTVPLEGGGATVTEEGGDLVLASGTGSLVLHGFYGLRFFQQARAETRVEQDAVTDTLRYRYRQDFGRAYGYGATLRMSTGGGVFAEWFRSQPYDHAMIRQRGIRFGLSWTH
jgi:hypothetical protein